ncbi:MAG: DUF2344 domain-containing protein [Lachnospiraceae bacterium]|nr:DUF2344 domain-containing protein [Lachnospiraceae bacterium]
MKYRIKFSKSGSMIFIGHLDMMRYFQKAIRRAEIPIAYSTGFSPHQIMSFAAPLGVGLYSNGEYLDIELTEKAPTKPMCRRLNGTMAEGVRILSVRALPDEAGNAMASVAAAGYTIKLRPGHEPSFSFGSRFDDFMAQETIPYEKETKKSKKLLDLKEGIFDYKVLEESIYLLLDASSSGNLKPSMIMEAYYSFMGERPGEMDFIVTREETYTKDQERSFISLEAVGMDIEEDS